MGYIQKFYSTSFSHSQDYKKLWWQQKPPQLTTPAGCELSRINEKEMISIDSFFLKITASIPVVTSSMSITVTLNDK